MTSVQWKSEKILKVVGSTIKKGVFTGGTATTGGVISKDAPTKFDENYISKLYSNIDGHVPLVIEHVHGKNETIGYAYKFGITDSKDDLKYQGFVFNEGAMNKIINEGYTYVSPEIVEDTDSSGKVTNAKLARISFTRNPSIDGTDINIQTTVFSKPTEENKMTETEGQNTEAQDTTDESVEATSQTTSKKSGPFDKKPAQTQQTVSATVENQIDVSAVLDDYKSKNDALARQVEQLLKERLDNVVGELKTQGIEDPVAIVKALPIEQKISVLNKLKDTVVKTTPLATAAGSTKDVKPSNDEATDADIDKAVSELLTEIGYSVDEYKAIVGDKK